MKRKLSTIAILGLVLSGLSAAPAHASVPPCLTIVNSVLTNGTTCTGAIIIPNSVTSIGDNAFVDSGLTSVTIPNSVTSIGDSAFERATTLTSVTIPNSVTSIGDSAFRNAISLTSVTIPNSVTTIGASAFRNAISLTSVTIPNSVTTIGSSSFSLLTSLTSLIIPSSVTTIGPSAFSGLTSLTSLTIPNSVTTIGDFAFKDATSLSSLTIPSSVTTIGIFAFENASSLTTLTIPNSVTTIGRGALSDLHALTSVFLPNSITSIERATLEDSYLLTSLTIPSSVTFIGWEALKNSGITNTTFLGPAPTVQNVNAFATLPAGSRALVSRAHIGSGAGRYGNVGSSWNGLIVEVPTSTLALTSEQAVTNQTVEFGAVPTDPQLTRAGFTLQGWSATQGGAAAFQADLSDFTMGPSASTLFAVWEASPASTASDEVEQFALQFSGPLLGGVDRRVFDSNSPLTMTLVGKRLHQITSATINGVKVEIQAKSRNSLILGKPGMAPGRYTLILETRSGTLTLPKFVIVE